MTPPVAAQLSLLVVDDVPVHRYLMVSSLERLHPGIRIEQASSFDEACAKLTQGRIDIVVSDWNMPGGDGGELVKWMRARVHFRRVPFVLISSNSDQEDIIQAFMELGVDAYVVKPFKPEDLYEKMLAALEKRLKSSP